MATPESKVRDAICAHLGKNIIHQQSMTAASMTYAGTPDRYIDGPGGDLWAEFKAVTAMPRSGIVGGVDVKKRGCYAPLQFVWMKRRWENSSKRRNVIGIIGIPGRLCCMQFTPLEWETGTAVTTAVTYSEASCWIREFCGK